MLVKLNPELAIIDADDGKVLMNIDTGEGFYIKQETFRLIHGDLFVDAKNVFTGQTDEALDELVSVLVANGILIVR